MKGCMARRKRHENMNKRKIASSALVTVGVFFLFFVVKFTIEDQFTDFGNPRLHIAGSIQTDSGTIIAALSTIAIVAGVKLRKPKRKAGAVNSGSPS